MSGHSLADPRIISGGRCRHELKPHPAQGGDRLIDVPASAGNVLNTLAFVCVKIFLDLAFFVGALVDGDADLAARARHGARVQSGELTLDIEVSDLAEVEIVLIPARPPVHAPAMNIVGEVIDVVEASALRCRLGSAGPVEIDVPD